MPALRASAESWEVLVIRPGREPLQSLATLFLPLATTGRAGRRRADDRDWSRRCANRPVTSARVLRARAARAGPARCLLFVDQLEELYTLVPDESERRAFTACLSGAADDAAAPLRVLVSMRSDFLDRVGEDRAVPRRSRCAASTSCSRCRARRCARRSRRRSRSSATASRAPRCSTEMVDSLAATPGSLPLLQFAGAKLWEARDERRKVLTAESYRQMGGISGVLAQHADRVVAALPPSLRASVRGVFQRLVTADGTRAIVDVAELPEPDRRSRRGRARWSSTSPRRVWWSCRTAPTRRARPSSWSTNR